MGPVSEGADPDSHGSRLKLGIWHPDCWTLEVTESSPGGLLGHGVHEVDGEVAGRFTAFADAESELRVLVENTRDSELTGEVLEVHQQVASGASTLQGTHATAGLLVRYDHGNSINDALISRGFIPDAPVRIVDGTEHWTVISHEDRETITAQLEEVRAERSATIDVELFTSLESGVESGMFRDDELSKRQREVFELAQQKNYYSWPRETSAGDLAEELGVSESTTLEHLRKAEEKLLGDPDR